MSRFRGQVALVTGASQGIGRSIALRLAREGADVAINYLSHRDAAESLAAEIASLGCESLVVQADVSDRAAVEQMVRDAVGRFGRLDVVVANAGFSVRQMVTEAIWEDLQRVLAVNQFGVIHTCQFAARQMKAQQPLRRSRGKIVIISSILAEVAPQGNSAYSMAKAAVNHFGETLAAELAAFHINVNMVNPGWIDTPGERHYNTEEVIRSGGQRIPWGRLGTGEDIAAATAFLASDDADYITGATLRVDGGMVLGLQLPT